MKNIANKKKEKKPLTYAEAHNKAFWAFHKSSRIMIWAGVLNVAGLIVGIVQRFTEALEPAFFITDTYLSSKLGGSFFNFSLCFSTNSFVFRLFEAMNLGDIGFLSIIIGIAIVFTAGAVLLGVFASQGKKWALVGEVVFYILDMAMIIPCYLIGEAIIYLWIMIGLHVIILGFLGVAIYQYYNLFTIEKIYKKD